MAKQDEVELTNWIAFRYSLEPSTRKIPYLKMPLVEAVRARNLTPITTDPDLLEKARKLGVPKARLKSLIEKAYIRVQVRNPIKK